MSNNRFPTEAGWYHLRITFQKGVVDKRAQMETIVRSMFPDCYLFEVGQYAESATKAYMVARKVTYPISKDMKLIIPTESAYIIVFPWNEASTQPYDHWLEQVKEHTKHPSTFRECMDVLDETGFSYEYIDHINNVLSYT